MGGVRCAGCAEGCEACVTCCATALETVHVQSRTKTLPPWASSALNSWSVTVARYAARRGVDSLLGRGHAKADEDADDAEQGRTEPIAECETNREDEEEEEAPIELEYRDVAKLLLTALACLVVIVLVTFGLHMVNEGERDLDGNVHYDKMLFLKNGTLRGLGEHVRKDLTRPVERSVDVAARHVERISNVTKQTQQSALDLANEHVQRLLNYTLPLKQTVTQELRLKIHELQTADGRTNLSRALGENVRDLVGLAAQGVNPVTFAIHETMKATEDLGHQAVNGNATTDALLSLGALTGPSKLHHFGYQGYMYAVSQFYIHDDAARMYCEDAVRFCARKQGCKEAVPPRHKLGKGHSESVFFVHQTPVLPETDMWEDYVATLLRMKCPDHLDCPIFFNDMRAYARSEEEEELLYTQDKYTLISRDFGLAGELRMAVEHPTKFSDGIITMLENPEQRLTRQFLTDSLSDPLRTRCANNTEEMAKCCEARMDTFQCSRYYNLETSTLIGKPWNDIPEMERWDHYDKAYKNLVAAKFMGLHEATAASMCLFLWQFQGHSADLITLQCANCKRDPIPTHPGFDELFEYNCLKPEVKKLEYMKERVEKMQVHNHRVDKRIHNLGNRGDRPELGGSAREHLRKDKYGYNFVGESALKLIKYDRELYNDAARLFWRRLAAIYKSHGLRINCNSAPEKKYNEDPW